MSLPGFYAASSVRGGAERSTRPRRDARGTLEEITPAAGICCDDCFDSCVGLGEDWLPCYDGCLRTCKDCPPEIIP